VDAFDALLDELDAFDALDALELLRYEKFVEEDALVPYISVATTETFPVLVGTVTFTVLAVAVNDVVRTDPNVTKDVLPKFVPFNTIVSAGAPEPGAILVIVGVLYKKSPTAYVFPAVSRTARDTFPNA
jgi:hypothetical protein